METSTRLRKAMSEQQPGRLALVRDDASRAADDPGLDPEVGQIRIARADRGAEMLVLLVEVHEQHVYAMLCGEECEWATETDAVLDPLTTGLPRRILIHGDVSGSILIRRLGGSPGQLEPHV